jgi:uncharacterized protein YkwD
LVLVTGCADDHDDGDGVDLPTGEHCDPVADWDRAWADFEQDVLALVNQHRTAGATCGGTAMPAVPPLQSNGALVCAARLHSLDMIERGFFDHVNPDGEEPWDRMDEAGYEWSNAGENIAAGQPDAESVMSSWMNSTGHCNNIMSGGYEEIGIGYAISSTSAPHWTQVFGAPL